MVEILADLERFIRFGNFNQIAAFSLAFALLFWWGRNVGRGHDTASKVILLVAVAFGFLIFADAPNKLLTILVIALLLGFFWAVAEPARRRTEADRARRREDKLRHKRSVELARAQNGQADTAAKSFAKRAGVFVVKTAAIVAVFAASNTYFGHGTMQVTPEGVAAAAIIGLVFNSFA